MHLSSPVDGRYSHISWTSSGELAGASRRTSYGAFGCLLHPYWLRQGGNNIVQLHHDIRADGVLYPHRVFRAEHERLPWLEGVLETIGREGLSRPRTLLLRRPTGYSQDSFFCDHGKLRSGKVQHRRIRPMDTLRVYPMTLEAPLTGTPSESPHYQSEGCCASPGICASLYARG
jgi:hypothetical protein